MKRIPLTLLTASCGENMGKMKLDSTSATALIKTGGKGSFVCGYCGSTIIDGQSLPNFSNAAGYCNNCGWLNHLTKPAKYPQIYDILLKQSPRPNEFIGRKHSFVDSGPYTSFLRPLNDKLYAYWAQYQFGRPDILCHYTTIAGLIGIIQSSNLWATDIRFLNDSTELQYASNILLARTKEEIATQAISLPHKTFWERATEVFKSRPSDYRFISCFCENGDLLSQWRGYAGGTGGFSIGFDSRIVNAVSATDPGIFLRRVIYEPQVQTEIFNKIISEVNTCITQHASGRTSEEQSNIIAYIGHVFGTLVEELLYAFKHPSFYEEKEWRFVITTDLTHRLDSLLFRTSNASIIPYTEIRYPTAPRCPLLPIRKIIQGPAANKDFGRIAVVSLLTKHGYEHVEVEDSAVPLRF
jgi:hypothetical protein